MTGIERFGLSPLIRFTLLSLYVALVLPLPLLAPAELRWWMVAGLLLGLVLVIGLLSERVEPMPKAFRCVTPPGSLVAAARLVHALAGHSGPGSRAPVGGNGVFVKQLICATSSYRNALSASIDSWSCWPPTPIASTKGIGRTRRPGPYQLLAGLAVLMIAGELVTSLALAQGWICLPAGCRADQSLFLSMKTPPVLPGWGVWFGREMDGMPSLLSLDGSCLAFSLSQRRPWQASGSPTPSFRHQQSTCMWAMVAMEASCSPSLRTPSPFLSQKNSCLRLFTSAAPPFQGRHPTSHSQS